MTLTDPRLAHGVLPVLIWTTGPDGELRYTVVKGIASRERLPRQAEFVTSPQGQRLWTAAGKELAPAPNPFQLLHAKH